MGIHGKAKYSRERERERERVVAWHGMATWRGKVGGMEEWRNGKACLDRLVFRFP